jgi:hypothetical protein
MPVPWYDRWKTTPPEPEVYGHCDQCKQEIYVGDDIYTFAGNNDKIHTYCYDDYAKRLLEPIAECALL